MVFLASQSSFHVYLCLKRSHLKFTTHIHVRAHTFYCFTINKLFICAMILLFKESLRHFVQVKLNLLYKLEYEMFKLKHTDNGKLNFFFIHFLLNSREFCVFFFLSHLLQNASQMQTHHDKFYGYFFKRHFMSKFLWPTDFWSCSTACYVNKSYKVLISGWNLHKRRASIHYIV